MTLPVWVTVLISSFVGGFVARRIDALLVLPLLLGNAQGGTLASNVTTWLLVDTLVNVAVAALLAFVLLPALSSVRPSIGTVFMATLVGKLIVFGGTFLLLRATLQSNLAAGGGIALLPAFGLLSLGLTALGIYVTATMIGSSPASSGGDGGRLDMYGGQAYFDEYRKGDQA
ncbi:MAG TPA: hypothetical protein VFH74_04655 [Gaiellales bacterium]|nr:hypothetical protein [Gaiellales bacterium]